jgi:Fe-S-cluster containining protein
MNKSASRAHFKSIIKASRSTSEKTECSRCCTCCAKGGPALHTADKSLIENGKIHGRFLFTIRQGEPAADNVKGGLIWAETDIIKIKSKENAEACLYADFNNNQCGIYSDRPLECRVLKCWDTTGIEALYRNDRLTRQDIIGKIAGLWDLIAEHQEKCSYSQVRQILMDHPKILEGNALKQLLEMAQYDISLRALVVEKTITDSNLLLFLFGTPLQTVLRKLGIEFKTRTTH